MSLWSYSIACDLTRAASSLVNESDVSRSDWSLELDKRVCLVVFVVRMRLAVHAEIKVAAYCTFVANASDVSLAGLVVAQWAIAKNAMMDAT